MVRLSGKYGVLLLCTTVVLIVLYTGCRKEVFETETGTENGQGAKNGSEGTFDPTPYVLETPDYFPEMSVPEENRLTEEGVALGKKLYYDRLLSKGGPLDGHACASCHLQEFGFTVPDQPVLAHVNLGWNKNFLWNGKVQGELEDIMMFEVNDFFAADMSLLQKDGRYPGMYDKAFGSDTVTAENTARALAQFLRTLVSFSSPYDRYMRKEEPLGQLAAYGYSIFNSEKGDCFHCHNNTLFTDNDFHNTGLDSVYVGIDRGRNNVTGEKSDLGKFKTPTLRNVALRETFMHDGRFSSLEEVVEHYNSGIKPSPYLDPIFTKGNRVNGRLGLTDFDKKALVKFLESLTDTEFLTDEELSGS